MAWEDRAYNRESNDGPSGPRMIFPMPSKLTFALIISNVAVFFIERLTGSFGHLVSIFGSLIVSDGIAIKQPWRWITYQYMHASGGHLFWNLVAIYFLVPIIERVWGWKRTLVFYTAGGIAAGITFWIMQLFVSTPILVGASGCIFAILGAITALMPGMQILAMMVIPITMRTLALLYTVLFIFTVVGDKNSSDAAHLGGLAFGFLLTKFGAELLHRLGWPRQLESGDFVGGSDDEFSPQRLRRKPSRWASKRALKLVREERAEQERIDTILAKVSAQGMHSLNWLERRALKKATEHQRQRDLELERRHR